MNSSHRQRAILFVIGLLLGRGGLAAWAGDYHRGGSLPCSDCHVMHYSEQHTQTGGIAPPLRPGGPFAKLLRANPADLCLSCHDGRVGPGDIAPDVMGSAGSGQAAARAAGSFQALPGTESRNGHSLLISAIPPGGSVAMTLDCSSCHDPHGNSYYRNLVPNPGGVPNLGVTAVSQTATTPTAAHYSVGNVRYTADAGGLSAWCGGCHGDFHGAGGSANMGGSALGDTNQGSVSPWLRHPSRDVTLGRAVADQHVDPAHWFTALASRLPVVSASGAIPGFGATSDNQVFCGTCHKAHGSSHRYGLIWDNPVTADLEDGAAPMESCQQCHYK